MTMPSNTPKPCPGNRIDIPVRAWMGQDETRHVVHARARFEARDPFAVTFTFTTALTTTVWRFGRALLTQVLTDPWCAPSDNPPEHGDPIGDGDVVLQRPHPFLDPDAADTVQMTLRSPDGSAVIYLAERHLTAFCRAMDHRVPEGAEDVDWELVIAQLLDAPRRNR